MACHGVPKVIITDGGPPYQGHEFAQFSRRMGFHHHITTPEDAQANGFGEAFVRVLVKLVHTGVAERKDPKKVLNLYLRAYRATPHKTTEVSPAELLFGRRIQTRLPQMSKIMDRPLDREVRETHEKKRRKQKEYVDVKRRAKEKKIEPGDRILVQQKKTTTKTPWDPEPYVVTEVKGAQVKARKGEIIRTRAKNLVNPVKEKPSYLQRRGRKEEKEELHIEISKEALERLVGRPQPGGEQDERSDQQQQEKEEGEQQD